jgi:hypothetical protein
MLRSRCSRVIFFPQSSIAICIVSHIHAWRCLCPFYSIPLIPFDHLWWKNSCPLLENRLIPMLLIFLTKYIGEIFASWKWRRLIHTDRSLRLLLRLHVEIPWWLDSSIIKFRFLLIDVFQVSHLKCQFRDSVSWEIIFWILHHLCLLFLVERH